MGTAVIVGSTSPIAPVVARRFAAAGYRIVLAARSADSVDELATRIEEQFGVTAQALALDVMDGASRDAFFARFETDVPDIVVSLLGRQEEADRARDDAEYIAGLTTSNLIAPAIVLERFATLMEPRGQGSLVGVSSIVGDRGRARNYTYGAAKAGFNTYLSGLRQRLHGSGVHVVTVKPGVIRIAGRQTRHPGALITSPEVVADAIVDACQRRRAVVYTPSYWRWVMIGIRLIPEWIFRRLRF